MRCRPLFSDWELKFELDFDDETVNRDDVIQWLHVAGKKVGLSDWRPKFGRFEVVSIE